MWKFNGDSSCTLEYSDVHKHVEGQIGSADITHTGPILQLLKWKLRVGLRMGPQALLAHSLSWQPNGRMHFKHVSPPWACTDPMFSSVP